MPRSDRALIRRAIYGALHDTIKNHGPIDDILIPSATKRILGALGVPKEETVGKKQELCSGCKSYIQKGEIRIKTRKGYYHVKCIPLPNPLIELI